MSQQPYIFNPPPPPPPTAPVTYQSSNQSYGPSFRGTGRGRGFRGGGNQRAGFRGGRGFRGGQHQPSPQHSRNGQSQGWQNGSFRPSNEIPARSNGNHTSRADHGFQTDRNPKRMKIGGDNASVYGSQQHQTSHQPPKQPRARLPGPPAAPSVPNFNALILPPTVLPPKAKKTNEKKPKKPKPVSLGLIPGEPSFEDSASEDDLDLDEESLAACTQNLAAKFSSGEPANLNDPVQLRAWLSERKKKFPTKKIRDGKAREREARKERMVEERRKASEKRAEQRQGGNDRRENIKEDKGQRNGKRKPNSSSNGKSQRGSSNMTKDKSANGHSKTQSERSRLFEEIKAQEEKLALLRAQLNDSKNSPSGADKAAQSQSKKRLTLPELSESDLSSDSSRSGSSSGTDSGSDSLSDSDPATDNDFDSDSSEASSSSAPEEQTSRRSGPIKVAAPPRRNQSTTQKQPCTDYLKGKCRRGRSCQLAHPQGATQGPSGPERVRQNGLLQKLVEAEKLAEDQKMVYFIRHLAEQGVLDDLERSENPS